MDFKSLKQFKPRDGEKYIIVEDGEPTAVLISFDDYRKMSGKNNDPFVGQPPLIEANNIEAENLAVEETERQEVEELKEQLKKELTIDDLPF